MTILISNLNSMTTTGHLMSLFVPFGIVLSARIIKQAETGRSLGVGYIEMRKESGAVAVYELNNRKFMNYFINVEESGV
jgi:RNA recognition motif-containing protein